MVRGKKESKNSMVQSLDAKESHVCNSMGTWDWKGICFAFERILYIAFSTPPSLTLLIHHICLSRTKAPRVQKPCSLPPSRISDSRTTLSAILYSLMKVSDSIFY